MRPAHAATIAGTLLIAVGPPSALAAPINLRPYELRPSDVGGAKIVYDRPQTGIPKIFRAAATRRFASARAGGSTFKLNQDIYLATSSYFARAVYDQLLRVELPKTLKSIATSTKLVRTVQRSWKVSLGDTSGGRVLEGTTTQAQPGIPKGTRVRFYVVAIQVGSALTAITALPNAAPDKRAEAALRTILARAAKREAALGTR